MSMGVFEEPTHRGALRAAWDEFKEGVAFQAFCLYDRCEWLPGPRLPVPIAWLCAPWGPLAHRFTRFNLARIFRPKKVARRQRLSDLCEYVFVCGGAEMT